MPRALRAVVNHVPHATCALMPYVSCALRALLPGALVPYVLHMPRASRVSCPTCSSSSPFHTLHAILLTTVISNPY